MSGHTLDELAERLGGRVVGEGKRVVTGVATLERATADQLSFLTNPRYREAAAASAAGALLVGPRSGIEGRDLLEVDEPYLALARLLELFHPRPPREAGISPLASVAAEATIGRNVSVEPYAVIEPGVELADGVAIGAGSVVGRDSTIGEASELRPRVVLYPQTRVGARCLLHSGVVLGSDGFGFATSQGEHHKVPQLGQVIIEDDVEIGANTTVDRGTLEPTVVGRGSKLDDLVMIAHGVQVGAGALLAAQSGISGSSRLGSHVTFAGQSGAAGHLTIGDRSIIGAKSAVFADLPPGTFVAGVPAVDHRSWKRSQAAVKRLPELLREVRALRARVAELERRLDGAPVEED